MTREIEGRWEARAAWNERFAGIEPHWPQLSQLYAGRILDVIAPGPAYAAPAAVLGGDDALGAGTSPRRA